MLPAAYFHVVFTVPGAIAELCLRNKETVYGILFQAAAETLLAIARDPKRLRVEAGFFAVLHSWGQNLHFHPHLHCVVPGGGLAQDGKRWIAARRRFFLPVRVLSALFRRLFVQALEKAFRQGHLRLPGSLSSLSPPTAFRRFLAQAARSQWVVHSKPPFGGPEHVLEYLGRYTHRVAISNSRIVAVENGSVSFRWKDYRDPGQPRKIMTVSAEEFIRRFLQHALPSGFQRIRYYGLFANCHRATKLRLCRSLLMMPLSDLLPLPVGDSTRPAPSRRTGIRCRECGGLLIHWLELEPVRLYYRQSFPDTS